ncbi:hypothetical protein HYS95_01570 [Candidatus Daviesbacteria bacterium]|nr:hypothetical protein [Candidatus Daviesbacteria bacterium]
MFAILLNNLAFPVLIFLALTFCGFIVTSLVLKTYNKLLLLGSGMIAGLLGFLLVLSLGSYIFKGYWGLWFWFLVYLLICLFLYLKFHKLNKLKELIKFRWSATSLITLIVLFLYTALIFLSAHRALLGGDTTLYFAISTSFAKGNYPTVSSWQPQFLPVYHMGALMLQGAIASLSGKSIELIHYLFSVFSISALMFFITGIVREKTRSVLSVLPAILGVILIGGPVISSELFASFQGSNGGGVVGLGDLIYNNFYALGLGAFLLFAVLFQTKRIILLTVLAALTLAVDETFFLIQLPFLGFLLFKEKTRKAGLIIILLVAFMVVLPNPIRDSVLTPQKAGPRFNLLPLYPKNEQILWNGLGKGSTADQIMEARLKYSGGKIIKNGQNLYYLLDVKLLLVLLFVGWLLTKRDKLILVLILGSFFSFLLSLVLINTFWPPNALRLANQAYNLGFLAFGLILLNLLFSKNKLFKLTSVVIILILVPSLVAAHKDILSKIRIKNHNNFTKTDNYQLLEEINKSIPANKVTLFLDRFPNEAPHSVYNYVSLTHFGTFVPLAPSKAKILNPDPGVEWFDGVNTLAPYALKNLGVEYVYVQDAARVRLSSVRHSQLRNPSYFEKVKEFSGDGTLYKVKNDFKDLKDPEVTIKSLVEMTGQGKNVYLGSFKYPAIRKGLILELAGTNNLYGQIPAHGGDFFMNIEASLPISSDLPIKIDFALINPEFNPNAVLEGNFQKILGNSYAALWKSSD